MLFLWINFESNHQRTDQNKHKLTYKIAWKFLTENSWKFCKNTILRTWQIVDEHKTRSWVPSCASRKYSQGFTKLNFGFWFRFRFTVHAPYYQRLKPPLTTGRSFWRVYKHGFSGVQGLTVYKGLTVHVRTVETLYQIGKVKLRSNSSRIFDAGIPILVKCDAWNS